ncbi:MAG: ABC transporter ATP-binding protein [Burkholderiaceae bacterium]|nr:ABC transporter ATP-binding protein [Burkholderiaceae bacterium]
MDNAVAGYGSVRVLHGVSLEIRENETVVLLGTNGNGKSTLIRTLFGLTELTRGSIRLEWNNESIDLSRMATEAIIDLGLILVPEGRRLFSELTVEENLMLGAFRSGARKVLKRNLDLCYEVFPIVKARRKQRAGSMSGGEQQMVALCRALMSDPRILVIDEPSVGLSPLFVKRTMEAIDKLKKERRLAVLMTEQNFKQAIRIADRGYIIQHGTIVFVAEHVADLDNSDVIRTAYLGLGKVAA